MGPIPVAHRRGRGTGEKLFPDDRVDLRHYARVCAVCHDASCRPADARMSVYRELPPEHCGGNALLAPLSTLRGLCTLHEIACHGKHEFRQESAWDGRCCDDHHL